MERGRERERKRERVKQRSNCAWLLLQESKKTATIWREKIGPFSYFFNLNSFNIHFEPFCTVCTWCVIIHFAQFARDHPFFQSSIHFPNRTWVDPVFAIKAPSVKRSGPACFGTVRFWVRKNSILLRLTHVWTSLYLEKFIWSSRIGSK